MKNKNTEVNNELFLLKRDIVNAYYVYINNCVDRNYLTSLFSKNKYLLGINTYNNKEVYVYSKDLSYIIYKHGRHIPKDDLFNMERVLDYDLLFKNAGKTTNEQNGFRFYKKSFDDIGWLEGATKQDDKGEEIFHFQYMRYQSMENKLRNVKTLLIENKLSSKIKM